MSKFGPQAVTDGSLHILGQTHGLVVALHRPLDVRCGQVALGAGGAALVAAEAEVVEVAALGVRQAQAAATAGAEDAAFEVVVVDPPLLPGLVVRAQHLLHPVEQ